MNILVREQVCELLDKICSGTWSGTDLDRLLSHDAAFRAMLEAVKSQMASELEMEVNAVVRQREELKRQLAQAQARIQELERATR